MADDVSASPSANPKRNYTVKNIDVIVKSADVLVRVFTLAPGDRIPWHFHSESQDHYFVLKGKVTIERQDPATSAVLSAGERGLITPGTRHSVANESDSDASFVLVQGVGKLDWLKA